MKISSLPSVFLTMVIFIFFTCSLPLSSKEPVKILFIGSSYFNYNNLPEIFRQLSEQGGELIHIDQHIPSGLFLADHAESTVTRSKIKSNEYPLHYLHFSDWNHPTKRGSYLMACLLYSTIFRESTVSIRYSAG